MGKGWPDAAIFVHLVDDLLIGLVLDTWGSLNRGELLEFGARPNAADVTDAGSHDGLVDGVGQSIVENLGRALRVGRVDADDTTGKGLLKTNKDTLAGSRDRVLDDTSLVTSVEASEDLTLLLNTL